MFTSPETESLLGLKRGTLEGPAAKWLEVLHPLDQDRFRAALDSVLDQRRGRLVQDFRLRTPDGHFMWFALKARPVVGSDGEVIRVVGTLTDVTESKNAEERMLHDSVHDNLTGLPNRKLFIDRLGAVANFAKTMPNLRPTVMVIDLDRFKQVNDSVGIAVGNSILLTLARRLTRILQAAGHAGPARRRPVRPDPDVGAGSGAHHRLRRDHPQDHPRADRLQRPRDLPDRLDRAGARPIRRRNCPTRSSRTPSWRCITPSASAATASTSTSRRCARRKTDRLTLESELRRAIEREEITILYQPIVRLEDRSIAGFEALARWDHPKLGRMSPAEFISIAEEIGLIVDLGMFVLDQTAQAARDLAARDALARADLRQRQRLVAAVAAARSDPRHPHRAVALLGGAAAR